MKLKLKGTTAKMGSLYSVVALMLCTAVYLNWSYTSVETEEFLDVSKNYGDTKLVDNLEGDVTSVISEENAMEVARLSKVQTRDEAIGMLQETLSNEFSTEEARTVAAEAISVMSTQVLAEGTVETMIKAKGYEDTVVFINDAGVNVLVSKIEGDFTAVDAAIIKDIILSETSVTADKIKIVESN